MVIKSQKEQGMHNSFFSVMHIDQRGTAYKKIHVRCSCTFHIYIYGPFLIGFLELAQPRYMPCVWERRSHKTVWCLAHRQLWTQWNIGAPSVLHPSNPSSSTWLNKMSSFKSGSHTSPRPASVYKVEQEQRPFFVLSCAA